jgi:pyruvate formate lyase activating enzyme
VLFLSGCPLRCLYCHNPDTWQKRGGEEVTVDQLAVRMRRYERFLHVSGGGVTISGGEPLMQPEFTHALLAEAKELGLHTALDTSGFLGARASDELLDCVDLVLLDIKAGTEDIYHRLTRGRLEPTLRFGRRLAERGTRIWVRYVLVPGMTDALESVRGVAEFAAQLDTVEHVDVLAFHKLGQHKYERLCIPFPLADTPTPSADMVDVVRDEFRRHGLTTP